MFGIRLWREADREALTDETWDRLKAAIHAKTKDD